MRFINLLFLSAATAFVVRDSFDDIYERDIQARGLFGSKSSKAASPAAAAPAVRKESASGESAVKAATAAPLGRVQSDRAKEIASKSRLLNPDVDKARKFCRRSLLMSSIDERACNLNVTRG